MQNKVLDALPVEFSITAGTDIYATRDAHIANPIDENCITIAIHNTSGEPLVKPDINWAGVNSPCFECAFNLAQAVPALSLPEASHAMLTFEDPKLATRFSIIQNRHKQNIQGATIQFLIQPIFSTNQPIFLANETITVIFKWLESHQVNGTAELVVASHFIPNFEDKTQTFPIQSVYAPHPEVAYFLLNRSRQVQQIPLGQPYWIYWKCYDLDSVSLLVEKGGNTSVIADNVHPFAQHQVSPNIDEEYLKNTFILRMHDSAGNTDYDGTLRVNIDPPTIQNLATERKKVTQNEEVVLYFESHNVSRVEVTLTGSDEKYDVPVGQNSIMVRVSQAESIFTVTGYGAKLDDGTPSSDQHSITVEWGEARVVSFEGQLAYSQDEEKLSVTTEATIFWETEFCQSCALYELPHTDNPISTNLQEIKGLLACNPGFATRTYQLVIEGYNANQTDPLVLKSEHDNFSVAYFCSQGTIYQWLPESGFSPLYTLPTPENEPRVDVDCMKLKVNNDNTYDPQSLYFFPLEKDYTFIRHVSTETHQLSSELIGTNDKSTIAFAVREEEHIPIFISTIYHKIHLYPQGDIDYNYQYSNLRYPNIHTYINEISNNLSGDPSGNVCVIYSDYKTLYYWNNTLKDESEKPIVIPIYQVSTNPNGQSGADLKSFAVFSEANQTVVYLYQENPGGNLFEVYKLTFKEVFSGGETRPNDIQCVPVHQGVNPNFSDDNVNCFCFGVGGSSGKVSSQYGYFIGKDATSNSLRDPNTLYAFSETEAYHPLGQVIKEGSINGNTLVVLLKEESNHG